MFREWENASYVLQLASGAKLSGRDWNRSIEHVLLVQRYLYVHALKIYLTNHQINFQRMMVSTYNWLREPNWEHVLSESWYNHTWCSCTGNLTLSSPLSKYGHRSFRVTNPSLRFGYQTVSDTNRDSWCYDYPMYQRCHCRLRPERFLEVMSLQDFFESLTLSPCTCTHDANMRTSTLSSYNIDKPVPILWF